MTHPYWPLFDLRITTPRLELRYPDDELVADLSRLAAEGIHEPGSMPFSIPWTRQPPGVLEREAMKHYWRMRATFQIDDWHLPFAVVENGVTVGVQELFAVDFPLLRTFQTGSWVGKAFQGHGIGTEMRAAALHLGFAGLDANRAETSAWHDNLESIAVTRKLGYIDNGDEIARREGAPQRRLWFSLSRRRWDDTRRTDIAVHGLDRCLELLIPSEPSGSVAVTDHDTTAT
jgi:RimJ/RimL family protein N-acetyltransferase